MGYGELRPDPDGKPGVVTIGPIAAVRTGRREGALVSWLYPLGAVRLPDLFLI
jgi:hypothetical protein